MAAEVRRQRRGGGGMNADPNDTRQMEEGADITLLRQVLFEKDMDAFGHFGQTVACLLREMPSRKSGRAMAEILEALHHLKESDD